MYATQIEDRKININIARYGKLVCTQRSQLETLKNKFFNVSNFVFLFNLLE